MAKDKTPMPPGFNPESFEDKSGEAPVQDAPKVTLVKDAPADAKPAQVVETKQGWFSWAWDMVNKGVTAVKDGVLFVVRHVMHGISWAYGHTLFHAFNFIERWVPGFGQLRSALRYYAVYAIILGAIIGGILFAGAGAGFFATLGGMAYGAFLVPWILVSTPSLYVNILIDLAIISALFIVIDNVIGKIVAWDYHCFWKQLGHDLWPGVYEAIEGWLANRAEVKTEPAATLVAA